MDFLSEQAAVGIRSQLKQVNQKYLEVFFLMKRVLTFLLAQWSSVATRSRHVVAIPWLHVKKLMLMLVSVLLIALQYQ